MSPELHHDKNTRVIPTPYWVSRVNLYPHRALRDESYELSNTVRALRGIVAEQRRQDGLAELLLQRLYEWAPRVSDEERRSFVLPFKRDVFNRRLSSRAILSHPLAAKLEGFCEWQESWRTVEGFAERLDQAHGNAETAERQVLAEWARDADVQRSIAVTSPSLRAALDRRARASVTDKRSRKSESALVQYFSRSTVRVSPFSLYTGVRIHRLDDEVQAPDQSPMHDELERTSVPALRRLLIRQASRRLITDPDDVENVCWRVNSDAVVEQAALRIQRRRWRDPVYGMKADAFTEDVIELPLDASLRAVVEVLMRQRDGATRERLVDAVVAAFSWRRQDVRELLNGFVKIGFLTPICPVQEQSETCEDDWLRVLAPMTGRAAHHMREALTVTQRVTASFGEADGARRVALLDELSETWQNAIGVDERVDSPLVEDAYVSRGLAIDADTLRTWVDHSAALEPLLIACDDQRILAGALETVFVAKYGQGGRCTKLGEFARAAHECFPLTQRLLAGDRPEGISSGLAQLLKARSVAVAKLVALARAKADEVTLTPQDLAEISAQIPVSELGVERSMSLFGQVEGRRFVLNHIYGGRLRYFSRYLRHCDATVTADLRRHNAYLADADAVTAHMRPTLGFNANLGPLMAPIELDLGGEPSNTTTMKIEDLHLVHTPEGLRLRRAADDRDVDLLYTGFLVPHALPSDEMLLAMLTGAPFYSFGDLTLDLHAGATAGEPHSERGTARICAGDLVLFRRRWALDAAFFQAQRGETAAAQFRRINAQRMARGIPDQVFVRPLLGRQLTPLERATSPKPQHIDFLSRLHVAHAAKRLEHLGPSLMAEEFLPEPQEGVKSARGHHAAELFFEINTTRKG